MPNVKGKKFPYTQEGKAAAAQYAQQHGAPFQMKAKGYNNSPMQKNFGKDLALNKEMDKSSLEDGRAKSSALQKRLDTTSKLSRKDMEGGLTGKPSTGKLDGPMRKSKSNMGAVSKLGGVGGKNSGIGMLKSKMAKGAKKIGLKKTGNIGAKLKQKYSGAAQRAGKVAKAGESQHQFKTRTRKPKAKAATMAKAAISGKFKKSALSPTVGGMKTPKLKATKGGLYKPGKTTTVKGVKATTKNTYGVLKSQKKKKAPAYKSWSFPKAGPLNKNLKLSKEAKRLLKAVPNKTAYNKLGKIARADFDKAAKKYGMPMKSVKKQGKTLNKLLTKNKTLCHHRLK